MRSPKDHERNTAGCLQGSSNAPTGPGPRQSRVAASGITKACENKTGERKGDSRALCATAKVCKKGKGHARAMRTSPQSGERLEPAQRGGLGDGTGATQL